MLDKGYDHPLYSLDLLPKGAVPPDPRYVVEVAQGLLVVGPQLLHRGIRAPTATCEEAVIRVCAHHALHEPLARSGFPIAWRDSLCYWRDQLQVWTGERHAGQVHDRLAGADFDGALAQATALFQELRHAARLGGIAETVVPQQKPRAILSLLDVLERAVAALERPEVTVKLAWFGFDQARAETLAGLVPRLASLRHGRRGIREDRGRAGDRIAVVRGAIVGDVGLFSGMATRVLGRRAVALRMGRLFPRHSSP